jgi:hypothetical protein
VIDGQIDYSTYTRAQLYDALRHIDRARYPLNLANLERALEALPPSDPRLDALLSAAVETKPKNRRARKWAAAIFVCVCLAIAALAALSVASSFKRVTAAIDASIEFVKTSPEAMDRLGAPISCSSNNGKNESLFRSDASVHVTLDVQGPKGQGVVTGDARRESGKWKFDDFKLQMKGETEPVELPMKESE